MPKAQGDQDLIIKLSDQECTDGFRIFEVVGWMSLMIVVLLFLYSSFTGNHPS